MVRIPNLFDQLFYYYFSEEESGSIHLNMYLTERVKPDILKKALNKALKRNGSFRSSPRIREDGFLVLIDNPMEADVYLYDDEPVQLGTKEVNGYLFRVMYENNRITVAAFHSICDGKGMMEFGRTLLYYYLTLCGHTIRTGKETLTEAVPVDPTEMADTMELLAKPNATPIFERQLNPVFTLPGEVYPLNSGMGTRRFQYIIETDAFRDFAHGVQSTFLPVLSSLIAETIREMYNTRDKVITMNSAVNMRQFYGNRSLSNFTELFWIPMIDSLFETDLATRAFLIGKLLMPLQLNQANYDWKIAEAKRDRTELFNFPVTDRQQLRNLRYSLWNNEEFRATFFTTNVGRTEMCQDMASYVTGADMYVYNLSRHPYFAILTHENRTVITLLQRIKNDALAKRFLQKLKKLKIPVKFVDCGRYQNDRLTYSKIPALE